MIALHLRHEQVNQAVADLATGFWSRPVCSIGFALFANHVLFIAKVYRMRKKTMWWLALAGVVVLAGALWGPIVSNVEQTKYKVANSEAIRPGIPI
jgi:hypothetical protein